MDHAQALRARYNAVLAAMGLELAQHPLRFVPGNDGSAHVEPLAHGGWLYRVTERGQVIEERVFDDGEQLLYHLARSVVAIEGARHQALLPPEQRDPRRADFSHRLALMGRVSPEWRSRLAEEMAQWLTDNPYLDQRDHDPVQREPRGWGGAIVAALLIAGLAGAHAPLVSLWQEQARLEKVGVTTRAQVSERHRTDGRFADTYRLDYSYIVAGNSFAGSDEVDWQTWRAADYDGARVDVLYDPGAPDTVMVAGNDRAGRLAWIYAAIDALLMLVILREWRASRKMAAAG